METHKMIETDWTKYKADSKRIMAIGSKSFFAASRLFPERLSTPATIIYAYCRLADDLVDYGGGIKAINELNDRLDAIYSGRPKNLGVDRDFAEVVKNFKIPIEYPKALIDGFLWDVEERTYDNIEQLLDYSARVAGSVGAMIALVMRVKDPDVIAKACELGIAMQLTNIARDIGEDANIGRLYLPRNWLKQEGICPDSFIKNPKYNDRIKRITKRLIHYAENFYTNSDQAIRVLPWDCRSAIFAARLIYADIGKKISHNKYNSIDNRAVVSLPRKLCLILKSYFLGSFSGFLKYRKPTEVKLVDSVTFLVDPIRNLYKGRCSTRPLGFFQRVHWVIDLFLKIEERNRYQLAHPRHPPR